MSSKQDLSKPHKCLTEKCKGNLVDPRKSYGRWAYWWGDGSNGWHNAPKSEWGAPLHWSDILRAHVATGLFVNETRIRKAILEQINLGNVRQDGRGLYQFRISLDPYYGDKEVA